MDPPMDQSFGKEVSPPEPATAAIVAVGMVSCSSSESGSKTQQVRPCSISGRQDFQTHVEAVQHGHRGLETALGAMCDRLLDLEGVVEKTREEHKSTETKYRELRQECLDRHSHLSGVNDTLRDDLSRLETRVEDLVQFADVEKGQRTLMCEVAPANDAAVAVVAAAVGREGDTSREDSEGVAMMREELHALKIKVDIIATNVLGEAESVIMDTTAVSSAARNRGGELREQQEVPHNEASRDDARSATDQAGMVADDTASIEGDKEIKSDDPQAKMYEGEILRQIDEGGGIGKSIVLPRCVGARNRWVKVRMHRAFLVKKIRRQVMAERKVSQSETIVTRVERLEKALGVNVYTKGSGRLDVLAREVRLSLAMIVEHQARAASDNLSAPLCLFPARPEDLPLISWAAIPSQPERSRASHGERSVKTSTRRSSHNEKHSPSSAAVRGSSRRGDEGSVDNGNAGSEGWGMEGGAESGDEGRLWMTEDGGYLCVELLLERTLQELVEGLAFAARCVCLRACLGQKFSRVSTPLRSGGAPLGSVPSPRHGAFDVGDATAASVKKRLMSWNEEGEEKEGSGTNLKKELERMQDRCTRLNALVARLRFEAAGRLQQQHPEQPGEERAVPRNDEQNRGERRETVAFAAEEDNLAAGSVSQQTAATAVVTSEVLRLSCALAGDLQYLLSRPAYCRVLDTFSFTPERKCLCGRDFEAAGNASTTPTAPAPLPTTGATATNAASRRKNDGGRNGGGRDSGGLPDQRCQPRQEGRAQ
ncbi:unnamed protein product, partial [Hapterophycus canaliculatus]